MKLGARQNSQEVSSLAGAWECEWVSCLGPTQEQADCLPLSLKAPSNSFSTSEGFPSRGVPILHSQSDTLTWSSTTWLSSPFAVSLCSSQQESEPISEP